MSIWSDLNVGLSGVATVFSGISSYFADKKKVAAQKSWQEYNNTIVNLSNAMTQNAITENEIIANASAQQDKFDLQKQGLITTAKAEVAAAAAGVKGNSVNLTLLNTQREIGLKEDRRQQSLNNAMLAFDFQRNNSNLQAAASQDYSYIEEPSGASYFLNTVTKLKKNKVFDYFGFGEKGGSGGSLSTGGTSDF